MQPKTQYARRGDVNIAYQVVGDGDLDLVWTPGFVSHVDLYWTNPDIASFIRRVASFARLIIFDKPGTGASDPVAGAPPLEERVEDMRAVMDAAGSERAALLGFSEGGPMGALFAATYPDRTRSLIVFGSFARGRPAPDYFWDRRDEYKREWDRVRTLTDHWGEGRLLDVFAPEFASNPVIRSTVALFERAAASPGMVRSVVEAAVEIDVRPILPTIRVPTLVIHRAQDSAVPAVAGRDIAERIPGARYVEVPGENHWPWLGDSESVLEEIEEFLTGTRHAPEAERVLATVLFTDIVGSTERAARVGDRRWRELLEAHDRAVRAQLERWRGREVKATGDGFLAAFDGPARAIRCALAINDAVAQLGIESRAGVHTGECEELGDDLGGLAVHIGARVAAKARPGEVLVSSTVKDLVVGSGIRFADRGREQLKGVPGEWKLFAAGAHDDGDGTPVEAPGDDHLRRGDRLRIGLARRAPGVSRLAIRATLRRREPSER